MMESLRLEGYRGFRDYHLNGLAPVNLLVGRNNCGKTSVLEAVKLLASAGDPTGLTEIAIARNELNLAEPLRDKGRTADVSPDISHLFYGHDIGPDSSFVIASENGYGSLRVEVRVPDEVPEQRQLYSAEGALPPREVYQVAVDMQGRKGGGSLFVTGDGALLFDDYRYRRQLRGAAASEPVLYVTADSLDYGLMADLWNKVVLEGREDDVVAAMRILEPKIQNIFFLSGERASRDIGRGGVLVGIAGNRRRFPLGSYGEGMRRMLALSLSLIHSAGGFLLVDEIDTGLHWSIMGDMWRLIVTAADRTGTQVFATTHSDDCLRGLVWLCRNDPELAGKVSLQRIDCRLESAVSATGAELAVAEELNVEMR